MSGSLGGNCECLALSQAGLDDLKGILQQRQVATSPWVDPFETTTRIACTCGQVEILKKLLLDEMMRCDQMNDHYYRSLALDIAVGSGDKNTVKDSCENNPELLEHSGRYGLAIPIVRASNVGHGEIVRYLHGRTPLRILMIDGGYSATCLLLDAIFFGFLDIALDIFDKVPPSLAVTIQPLQRSSPLRFLALKPDLFRSYYDLGFWKRLVYSCIHVDFQTESVTAEPNRCQSVFWMTLKSLPKCFGMKQLHKLKDTHFKAQKLLQKMCDATKDMVKNESWKLAVHEALLEAVENGNKEFFIELISCNRELLWISEATSGENLFHLAVKFRKEKIFNLVYGLGHTQVMLLRSSDRNNNNILHIAAHLSPTDHLSKLSGSALKLQRDIQWFREVESLVSEREVVQRNNQGKTPRQIFEESHETLRKEGEEWMKYTATACSFVAALIATVTFQAIFTVPGGYDDIGKPILLRDKHFTMFIFSDSLAFFASSASVLIFLSILTARYSFDDFIETLPRRMILGLFILFFSIVSLFVAFTTALSSTMRQRKTLVYPMKLLATLPILFFFMLEYPLLKEIYSSTYGKGIFHRNTKSWFLVPRETQVDHVASSSEG